MFLKVRQAPRGYCAPEVLALTSAKDLPWEIECS